MAKVRLKGSEIEDQELPFVCLKCGREADQWVNKLFDWHSAGSGFLRLMGPVHAPPQLMRAQLPMCRAHRNHWFSRTVFGWGVGLGLMALLGGLIALAANSPTGQPNRILAIALGVNVLGILVWVITMPILIATAIRPTNITDDSITLTGVSPKFVERLAESRGLRREKRDPDRRRKKLPEKAPAKIGPSRRCPACTAEVFPTTTKPEGRPQCPRCGAFLDEADPPTVPVIAPVAVKAPLDPTLEACPQCGNGIAASAVVCIECGFHRGTGKRLQTKVRRYETHHYSGGFPYWGRLVLFAIVLSVLGLIAYKADRTDRLVMILSLVGLVSGVLIGTLRRFTITRDPKGQPILIHEKFFFFVPCYRFKLHLKEYNTIKLNYSKELSGAVMVSMVLVPFLLGILPGIYLLFRLSQSGTFSLQLTYIEPGHVGSLVEPYVVCYSPNEQRIKKIATDIEQIAKMRYG